MSGPRREAIAFGLLAALNLVALNVLVRPVRARVDLTEAREYTISDVTRRLLASLEDRVEVIGTFSEETHPKLAPLIPKLRDLVEEYAVHSGGKLVHRFVDPSADEEAEKEAFRRFDVRPHPFQLATKYESAVRSAYFSLVVAKGDKHAKLDWRELIEVVPVPPDDLIVRLRNPEYHLTRAIERVARAFGDLETRLAERPDQARLIFFVTDPAKLPEGDVREYFQKRKQGFDELAEELRKRFKAGFTAEVLDPAERPELADEARKRWEVGPIPVSALSQQRVYLDAIVALGERFERIPVRDAGGRERSPAEMRGAVEAGIRRLLPGALKRVAFAGPKIDIPPEVLVQYYQRGMKPPGDEFQALRAALRKGYEVQDADLSGGRPPLDADVLVVAKPKEWTEEHRVALDQYLMHGGRAILLVDATQPAQGGRAGAFSLQPLETGLEEALERWGVTVRKELIADDRCGTYPLEVDKDLGGLRIRMTEDVAYPYFLDVRGDSIDRENPVVGGVERLEMFWASPVFVDEAKVGGARVSKLVTTSHRAWTTTAFGDVAPRYARRPQKPYAVPPGAGRHAVAVAIDGRLESAFRDRPEAVTGPAGVEPILESPPGTRLVVIGDADFVSDPASQTGGFRSNLQFIENLIDWALLDEDMIRIRSRGAEDRPLRELERETKMKIEAANYGVPIGLVAAFGILRGVLRRRAARRVPPGPGAAGSKEAAK